MPLADLGKEAAAMVLLRHWQGVAGIGLAAEQPPVTSLGDGKGTSSSDTGSSMNGSGYHGRRTRCQRYRAKHET